MKTRYVPFDCDTCGRHHEGPGGTFCACGELLPPANVYFRSGCAVLLAAIGVLVVLVVAVTA